MYVNPFVCGVVATILVELVGVIIIGIFSSKNDKEDK